jgi:hypothetical protein
MPEFVTQGGSGLKDNAIKGHLGEGRGLESSKKCHDLYKSKFMKYELLTSMHTIRKFSTKKQ